MLKRIVKRGRDRLRAGLLGPVTAFVLLAASAGTRVVAPDWRRPGHHRLRHACQRLLGQLAELGVTYHRLQRPPGLGVAAERRLVRPEHVLKDRAGAELPRALREQLEGRR